MSESSKQGRGDYPGEQYSGEKKALRPIYDRLVSELSTFGSDVEIAEREDHVDLLRSGRRFGTIEPVSATRLEVGISLPDEIPTVRLEPDGSEDPLLTHRVSVRGPNEVDPELIGWLRVASEGT